jgi:hypothetical protein
MGNVLCCCRARDKESGLAQKGIFDRSFSNDDPDITQSPRKSILKSSDIKNKTSIETNDNKRHSTDCNESNKLVVEKNRKISFGDCGTFPDSECGSKGTNPDGILSKATTTKSLASKYFIKLTIDHLELYNKCDNFGYYFKPFLEIDLENQETVVIKSHEDDISNTSDIDMLSNSNLTINRLSTSICLKKEKTINFKFSKVFEIKSQELFGFMSFRLKSEALKDLEVITIAECNIPLIMLYNHYKNIPFDGNLEMLFRCSTFIGYLKVSLTLSENSAFEDIKGMLQKAKFFEEYDDKNNGDDQSAQIRMLLNVWEHNYINLDDMSNDFIEKYFNNSVLEKEQYLQQSLAIPRKFESKIDAQMLAKLFNQYIHKGQVNQLALYQLLMLLVKITEKDQCQIIINFFKLLKNDDISLFYNIPVQFASNPYIVKYFLILFDNLQNFYKHEKVTIY